MPSLKLTAAAADKLQTDKTQEDYWDTLLPQFGLRITKKGTKTWIIFPRVLIQGEWRKKRFKLDRYPALELKEAREMARTALATAAEGGDPQTVIQQPKRVQKVEQSAQSFSTVRDDFLEKYRTRKKTKPKPRTLEEMRRTLESNRLKDWRDRPLAEINKRDVLDVLDELISEGKEARANTYLVHIRMMMNWAVDREIIPHAPTERIKPPGAEVSRERVLEDEELKAIWKATLTTQGKECNIFGPLVRLLLLTGQRRSEAAGMRWTELDLDAKQWEIPGARTKNKLPHVIPLSDLVIEIIKEQEKSQEKTEKSPLVFTCTGKPFSGWSRSKERLDSRAKTTPWRLHDLRRTLVTHMNEMGVLPHIVEAIVNHVSGTRGGVAGVYNRALYIEERKKALDEWAGHILEVVDK
ncbi:MAG: tyrosine-type recombinase/integrase [Candidatus Sedimenticola sp. 20ELBAFRAG]